MQRSIKFLTVLFVSAGIISASHNQRTISHNIETKIINGRRIVVEGSSGLNNQSLQESVMPGGVVSVGYVRAAQAAKDEVVRLRQQNEHLGQENQHLKKMLQYHIGGNLTLQQQLCQKDLQISHLNELLLKMQDSLAKNFTPKSIDE